jgi:DNA topoisomerase I
MPRKKIKIPEVIKDPIESAKLAKLRYVSDEMPGIRRRRAGKGFSYLGADGKLVRDEATLARIKKLAIPPAWRDVWICPYENGHIQAIGFDERGRKQYRYHERWRAVRDETKYARMMAFGAALPRIRARVDEDLKKPGLPREKVLAAIVRLMEKTAIRVGNEEYARTNKSYGLTTMKNRHAQIEGAHLVFKFKGKSGVRHTVDLDDRRLARIVAKTQELPGQDLFQWVDNESNPHTISSGDVNEYLREAGGEEFTAKDFRTWTGTVLAALALRELEAFDSQTQAKKNVVAAIENVARRLGNTPSVCRKCYVHPAVLDSYLDGTLREVLEQKAGDELRQNLSELPPEEAAVLSLLHKRLVQNAA